MIEQVKIFDTKLKNTAASFSITLTVLGLLFDVLISLFLIYILLYIFLLAGVFYFFYGLSKARKKWRRYKSIVKDIQGHHYAVLPVKAEQPGRLVLYVHPLENTYTLRSFALQAQHTEFLDQKRLSIDIAQNNTFQFQKGDTVKLIFARYSGLFLLYNQTKDSCIYFEINFFQL